MVKIKSLEDIATKYVEVAPTKAPYYEKEVKAAGDDWKEGALAGQKAYETAMRDPKVLARRKEQIDDAAKEKYVRKAGTLGPDRYAAGTAAAKEDFRSGFEKYHGVIAALTLPERGPRGDPKNINRVKAVADALHKARVGAS